MARHPQPDPDVVFTHVFTSGVPSPGNEAVHLNFYVFDNRRSALRHGVEVAILEKFEYLPSSCEPDNAGRCLRWSRHHASRYASPGRFPV